MRFVLGPPIQGEILINWRLCKEEQQDLFWATTIIPAVRVTEILHSLKWPSISSRVNAFKLQMMYKIIHRIVDLKLPNYITFNSSFTRGHNYKLTVPPLRIDAYKFSFFPSTITLWNKLLVSTVNAATIDTFTDLIS